MEHEADSILSIPLSTKLPVDRLVLSAAVNRRFSVKSACHLARNRGIIDRGESSDSSGMRSFWRKLWRTNIPNKIRTFGWKACQNILPTKMNLFQRKIIEDPTCDACGLCPETIVHVLCQCPKAVKVWSKCNLLQVVECQGDFIDTVWQCERTQSNDSNLLEMILMIAWGIWKNRNEVRHGGRRLIAMEIAHQTRRLLEEFSVA